MKRMHYEQTDTVEATTYKPHPLASSQWAEVWRLPVLLFSIVVIAGIPLLFYAIATHWSIAVQWIGIIIAGVMGILGLRMYFYIRHKWHIHAHEERMARLDYEERQAEVQLKKATRRLLDTAMERNANVKIHDSGAVEVVYVPAQVPARVTVTQIDEASVPKQLPQGKVSSPVLPVIPTFAQSLASGDIYPGQEDMLICYELTRDDDTREVTGIVARRDRLENNCTLLLGGASKSGKTTFMSHLAAQQAMMNALFYVIDPHLTHPEKSIAVRLAPFKHAFILPPAMTDTDVYAVLHHAQAEAEARLQGRETAYSGRPIVFIVDEALALISRAQRTDNADIQQLYRDLMLFMRDLGTQYNKYEVNGIFATQYVTKEAFKIPNCPIDFRDACQSNTLFRLPANQAQAMRLLQRDELRDIRSLPQGHGYMGFYDGDIIRMASGNVTMQDLQMVGRMVMPTSMTRRQYGYSASSPLNGSSVNRRVITGALQNGINPLDRREPERTVQGQTQDSTHVRTDPGQYPRKRFTSEQELTFIRLYQDLKDIKKCLGEMHLGVGTYRHHASEIVREKGL